MKGRKGHVGKFDSYPEGHKDVQIANYGRESEAWFLHKRGSSVHVPVSGQSLRVIGSGE